MNEKYRVRTSGTYAKNEFLGIFLFNASQYRLIKVIFMACFNKLQAYKMCPLIYLLTALSTIYHMRKTI